MVAIRLFFTFFAAKQKVFGRLVVVVVNCYKRTQNEKRETPFFSRPNQQLNKNWYHISQKELIMLIKREWRGRGEIKNARLANLEFLIT
jgi:hypothetical protein